MYCENCKDKLENRKSFKVFKDVAMISVGLVLALQGVVMAIGSYAIIYVAILVLKKYDEKKLKEAEDVGVE